MMQQHRVTPVAACCLCMWLAREGGGVGGGVVKWNVEDVCVGHPRSVGVVGHKQRLLGCCSFISGGLVLPLSGQAVVLWRNAQKKTPNMIPWITPGGDEVKTA